MQDSILGAYGEHGDGKKQQEPKLDSITMLYYPDMDTNPASTNCLANHELLKLVYSPLISVNAGFEPICILAENWTVDHNTAVVKIKSGLKFSNGEPVYAHDVVKSFNAVKNAPQSPYYQSVRSMYRYYAKDDLTFVCEFNKTDVDCIALLDIPIMYNGNAGYGCGAFVFSQKNGKPVLVPNENYFQKASVPIINLVETKTDDYIDDMFSAGALDIMDSSVVDRLSLTSLRDYNIVSCPSNNFIYIGINHNIDAFKSLETRRAISDIIDRDGIAKQSLVDLASPTNYPFSPEWYRIKQAGVPTPEKSSEAQILSAASKLSGIGLTLTVPSSGYKHTIALELVRCFKEAGLTLTLRELESDAYISAITSGNFELYLGQSVISRDMDPTYLYSVGGQMNYGGYANYQLDEAFSRYKSGEIQINDYLLQFDAALPIIPVLFSKSVLYCAQGIAGFADRSAFNVYGNGARITLK